MKRLVVTDFDGCLCMPENIDILDDVASSLVKIATHTPVIILSARATEKAVQRAALSLQAAGLAHFPFVYRDMKRFTNSDTDLIAYKNHVINTYALQNGLIPAFGIGDHPTDEIAYLSCNMEVHHLLWENISCPFNPYVYHYLVSSANLATVWESIVDSILSHLNKT